MRNSMGDCLGLTRTGASDHQQRANVFRISWFDAVFHCSALLRV
jgi:hypothetical protein